MFCDFSRVVIFCGLFKINITAHLKELSNEILTTDFILSENSVSVKKKKVFNYQLYFYTQL